MTHTAPNDTSEHHAEEGLPFVAYAIAAATLAFVLALGIHVSGVFTTSASSVDGPLDFDTEARKVTRALGCRDAKVTPPLFEGDARLYGCIMGAADTAKYFINEDRKRRGTVANVKVMWNDWRRDHGYGLHADRHEAIRMVRTFAKMYAASIEDELVEVFQGAAARSYIAGQYRITFKSDRGPGIEEHLMTLAPR